jgi:hypothetical protein
MKNFFLVLLASFFFCSLLTDSLAEQKVVQGTKEEVFCLSRKWTFRPPAVSNYRVPLNT